MNTKSILIAIAIIASLNLSGCKTTPNDKNLFEQTLENTIEKAQERQASFPTESSDVTENDVTEGFIEALLNKLFKV